MKPYDYVDTRMGAVANEVEGHGGGKTYPGAVVPFGMVQLSPDTITGGDNGAGYSYGHPTIEGFSFVHLSGIGWFGEFGNLQTMPVSGERRWYSGTNEYSVCHRGDRGWESHFDHDTEVAKPGYYAVTLTDCAVRAEATAARHTGALRFTFAQGGASHLLIDLHRRVGGCSSEQEVTVVDPYTVRGRLLCTPAGGGWGRGAGNVSYELFFVGRFSRPMTGWAYRDNEEIFEGGDHRSGTGLAFCADFDLKPGETVEFHAGISFVDAAGAENNFSREDQPFDAMLAAAVAEWETVLQAVAVEGGTDRDRQIFYSCLYRASLDPRAFSDDDGRYRNAMGAPQRADGFVRRTMFSGWDVYRSAFPLYSLIRPDVVRDEVASLLEISREQDGARFARWEIVGIDSGCMIGDPGANVLADAVCKGIGGFDAGAAYAIIRRWWLGDRADQGELIDFNRIGYNPCSPTGATGENLSVVMEYSFTAWCLGNLAKKLGHADDAEAFFRRAQNYRNLYDPAAGWFNNRRADGTFLPFDSKYSTAGCTESNIYQQTWFVPHDSRSLRAMMGEERFDRELEELFAGADLTAFWNDNYNHSNEPVHTVPHLFVHIGKPDRTQYRVRRIQEEAYRPGPYGYCGNEDVGQLSAWFALTAMGLHQSAVSGNVFELNTPLFSRVSLRLNPAFHACRVADTLTVTTDRDPVENGYIAGVTVNGQAIDRAWLSWEELANGGEIRFALSAEPTAFGRDHLPAF